jgi:hypothetical protein
MKKLAFLFLILSVTLLPGQAPPPLSIPIQNPSFQQGETGWDFGSGSRLGTGPDGTTDAVAGFGSMFSQTLTTTPAQVQEYTPGYARDGVYTLKFSVANYYPTYPGYYKVEIDFGTQELCESDGWGTRPFTQVTVTCPSPGYIVIYQAVPGGGAVQGNQPFVIHFTENDGSANGGWSLFFKDVSMTFTAEE